MGELILREEGYEVVTITDGATVLLRLPDRTVRAGTAVMIKVER